MLRDHHRIAIVGATGAVGRELLGLLAERGLRPAEIRLLSSPRSAGQTIPFAGSDLTVAEATESSFQDLDAAFFCADADTARRLAPAATAAGCRVIDNSSAFRADPAHPLIVPEVNPHALGSADLVANPNCSTIILLVPLAPLHRRFHITRAVVSTYQAASGAGAPAMEELRSQTEAVLAGKAQPPEVFAEPCAFNVFSHDSALDPTSGDNVEEAKMLTESRKILTDPTFQVTTTCIRVPVLRAHAESVNITLRKPATLDEVRDLLESSPGVTLVDDRERNDFPTSLKASGQDSVLVGRIRPDRTQPCVGPCDSAGNVLPGLHGGSETQWHGYSLFIAGDQIRKGAATNALQIAGLMLA